MAIFQIFLVLLLSLSANAAHFSVENSTVPQKSQKIGSVIHPSVTPTVSLHPENKSVHNVTLVPTRGPTVTPKSVSVSGVGPTITSSPSSNSDHTAPTLDWLWPSDGTVVTTPKMCVIYKFSDEGSGNYDLLMRYQLDNISWSGWATVDKSLPCYEFPSGSVHTFRLQAKDAAGNETGIISRNFSVLIPTPTPQFYVTPVLEAKPTITQVTGVPTQSTQPTIISVTNIPAPTNTIFQVSPHE